MTASLTQQDGGVAVTQADRDAAADIWRDYIARTGEIIVERQMRSGGLDDGLPAILARHRIAASAAAPALVEALEKVTGRLADYVFSCGSADQDDDDGQVIAAARRALAAARPLPAGEVGR